MLERDSVCEIWSRLTSFDNSVLSKYHRICDRLPGRAIRIQSIQFELLPGYWIPNNENMDRLSEMKKKAKQCN